MSYCASKIPNLKVVTQKDTQKENVCVFLTWLCGCCGGIIRKSEFEVKLPHPNEHFNIRIMEWSSRVEAGQTWNDMCRKLDR